MLPSFPFRREHFSCRDTKLQDHYIILENGHSVSFIVNHIYGC
ncbi:hypothetical protein L1275_000149 [Flavobacterium sp. HSC-61S13]|nr:hypothetical protein [Flavobacterium sp. HSC-61S13]